MSKTNLEDKLVELFNLLCEDFKTQLDAGEMSTKDRQVLIEFLKDNNISCDGMKNRNVRSITEKLPFSEEVENNRAINQ